MSATESSVFSKHSSSPPTPGSTNSLPSRPANKLENHYGIDTVVQDLRPPFFNQISCENCIHPARSHHGLSSVLAASASGCHKDRLVVTLLYKIKNRCMSTTVPSSPVQAQSPLTLTRSRHLTPDTLSPQPADPPASIAPSSSPETFPLELPAAEPDSLDHLYGSFISPNCVSSFVNLMSTFPRLPEAPDLVPIQRPLDNAERPLALELTLIGSPVPRAVSLAELRKNEIIYNFEREWNVDIILQPDTVWRRHPRLVAFDMDSTLITNEVIDLLASAVPDRHDLAARVADLTHRAMLGELEFESAFRERVALLQGVPVRVLDDLRPMLEVTTGVRPLMRALKRLGVQTAVISGGFQPLTSWLAAELGIDHAWANNVVVDADGRLTGEVTGAIIGKERKRDLLLELAAREGLAREQIVAVGDGANDLLMLAAAGLGVAWRAKPLVQMEAGTRLNGESLLDLLYLFGFSKEEIDALTA